MTGENMKSDLNCSNEYKIERRQSIHARKMSKTSPTRNGDVGTNVHIAGDGLPLTLSTAGVGMKDAKSHDCQKKMDKSDGKTGFNTPSDGRLCMKEVMKVIDETPETKHLKDLLLLHLDWSQQQQETILLKEKQIQDLRSERDALKCRLDRMERRMSLLRQKGSVMASSPAVRDSPRSITPVSAGRESYGRGQKRKISLEPQNLTKRFSLTGLRRERSGSAEKEQMPRAVASATSALTPSSILTRRTRLTSEMSDSVCSTASSSHNQSRSQDNTETECTDDDGTQPQLPKTRNFFRKRWQTDNLTATEVLSRRQRLRQIVFKRTGHGQEDEFLRTDCMYYVNENKNVTQSACISPVKPEPEPLKVPSWRIHHVPTGYQLEGTENLDDEIFAKRHQKPEQEERRRKRWDMQRIREQHLYEKLQGRYPDTGSRSDQDLACQTFLPDPEDAKFIEVNERIPVSAFGFPIPDLKSVEFSLPWFDVEKRERLEKKLGRPKKYR